MKPRMTGFGKPKLAEGGMRSGGIGRRLVRNGIVLLGGSGGASLLMLLAVAVNSRALTLNEFGAFALLQATALLIAGFFSFATQQPVVKLGVEAIDRGDNARFERLIGMGFIADLAAAIGAAALATGFALAAPALFGTADDRVAAALVVAISLLFQGYRTSEGIFRTFDRFGLLGLIQVLSAVVQVGIAVVLWWLDAPFTAYAWLAATTIALSSLLQLAGASVLLRCHGLRPRFRAMWEATDDRREFVSYCWSTWATGSLDTVRMNGDAPLVGLLVSVEAAGIYNVARQVAGVLRKGTQIYGSVFFPELAMLASRRETARAQQVLRKLLYLTLAITVAGTAAAILVGGSLLHALFGPEFEAGHLVLVLLFAAAGIQLLSATYSMYIQAFVGPGALFVLYVLATLSFAAVIVPSLLMWGMAGAGAAQIVFFVVLAVACGLRLRRFKKRVENTE